VDRSLNANSTSTRTQVIRAELIGSDQCDAVGITLRGYAPVLKICRHLIAADFDPSCPLLCYRGTVLALAVRSIGEGARLRIATHGVGFERLLECTGGPPASKIDEPVLEPPRATQGCASLSWGCLVTVTRPTLKREAFKTSRFLEFCSEKELVNQTGHAVDQWPLVILKELVDNAIDGCEEAEITPVIEVIVRDGSITVSDNGPGIGSRRKCKHPTTTSGSSTARPRGSGPSAGRSRAPSPRITCARPVGSPAGSRRLGFLPARNHYPPAMISAYAVPDEPEPGDDLAKLDVGVAVEIIGAGNVRGHA
jgi:hypothetical protein